MEYMNKGKGCVVQLDMAPSVREGKNVFLTVIIISYKILLKF